MSKIDMSQKNDKPIIAGTWMSGGNGENPDNKTVILAVPKAIAVHYDIYKRTSVLITPTDTGFLVRKLEVQK
jgi:hypothetical protein